MANVLTEDKTCQRYCGTCGGFWFLTVPAGTEVTGFFAKVTEAEDAHPSSPEHLARIAAGGTHIRKQINPRKVRTGNQFYARRDALGPAENGSQTMCGGPATTTDIAWAEARFAKNIAHVTCEDCKTAYAGAR